MKGVRQTPLAVPLLLGALVLLAFAGSLRGDFVWDDRPLIQENPRAQDPGRLGELLTSSFWETGDRHDRFRFFFRPLVSLTYLVDHAVWGLRPLGFHLTNVLLHLLCCGLVFRIARQEGLPLWPGFVGAALFAVHPVHVESVAWISGRTDVVCAALMLSSFLVHRRLVRTRSRTDLLLAVSLFVLALFAKEMAATLPLLIFADRWRAGRTLRSGMSAAWPYLLALAGYVVVRQLLLGGMGEPLVELTVLGYAATALFVVARYITLLLLPLGLDAHYPFEPLESPASALVLVAAAMLLVVLLAGRRLAARAPASAFWLSWIFIALLPVLSFGRFGDVIMADRFLYIPSVGLCLLAAHAAEWLSRSGVLRSRAAVAVPVLALLVGLALWSHDRGRIWRTDHALFRDMVRTSPASALVRSNLGLALYHRGEFDAAERELRRAIALAPTYSMAHNNLAATLQSQGRLEEALRHYREALALAPESVEARVNAGHLLTRLGQTEKGLAMLRGVIRAQPRFAEALYFLAEALERTGMADAAMPYLERAIEADPRYPNPYYLLGKIRFEQGRSDEARFAMQAFLDRWPDDDRYAEAARWIVDLPAGHDL